MTENDYRFRQDCRYMTRGVNEEVPLELQILMWKAIDEHVENQNINTDYLQIFNLEVKKDMLCITHTQEVPQYKKVFNVPMKDEYNSLVNRKIYVIDDIEHSTMLFSSEY